MGSPYLSSGEAIILTTNRVSADAVPYDVMLTSERIFLIDNRNARFEPRIIPLNAILSVQGGKTPSHDPVITLLFRSGEVGGARQPLNLIFSQNPNENRKLERDDWIRNLIQLSISLHEREAVPETPVIPDITGETGLRPAVRHSVAPEKVRPLSHGVERQTVPVPVTVIPDEVEGSGEIPVHKTAVTPVEEEHPKKESVPGEPLLNFNPVRGSPHRIPDLPSRDNIPQIIEEQLPVTVSMTSPVEQEPVSLEDTEAQGHSTQIADLSPAATEKPAPESPRIPEPAMTPAVPVVETGLEQAAAVPLPATAGPREMAEIIEEQLPVTVSMISPVEQEPVMLEDTDVGGYAIQTADLALAATEKPAPEPPGVPEPAMTPAVPVVETGPEQAAAVPPPAAAGLREMAEIIEEELSVPIGMASPVDQEPAPEPSRVLEPAMTPAVPVVETGPEQAAAVPLPAAAGPREMAEIIRGLHIGTGEFVTTEQSDTATSDTPPEPEQANPDAGIRESPESHAALTIPENMAEETVSHPAPGAVFQPEPAAAEASPIRHPIPPSREIRPLRTTLVYAAVLLLAIAVIAVVAVPLLSQGPGQPASPPITSTPGIIPGTTSPPVTVQPTTIQPTIVPPVTPRITTASPSPSLPLSVPLEGVWVGVNSTSNYTGRVGNAGFMQPFSGFGNNFYKVRWSDRTVQVSVQKQDNSGALLAVAIYRNGTLISTSSVTSPAGSIDMLIDPLTARAPGLTVDDTRAGYTAPSTGLENY